MTRTRKGPGSLTEGETRAKKRHPDTRHGSSRRQHQARRPDADSMAHHVEASRRAAKRPNNSRPAPPSTSWQQIGHPAARVVARIWMEGAP